MIDTVVLSIATSRTEFQKINASLKKGILDEQTERLLEGYGKYFKAFPKTNVLPRDEYIPWYVRTCCTGMTRDDAEKHVRQLQASFSKVVLEEDKETVLTDIVEATVAKDLYKAVTAFDDGDLEEGIIARVSMLIDEAKSLHTTSRWSPVSTDVLQILTADMNDEGVAWRLKCVNTSMRKMRRGDFGIVAARPDKGKTTLLASEATYWASQLPHEKGRILWLNNEGLGERIVPRLYQSALGYTQSELIKSCEEGRVVDEYVAKVGHADKIQIVDIHGWNYGQVATVIEQIKPDVVIYDMIDHIAGFSTAGGTHERLESLYKWAREQCVKASCIGIASSQISIEGEGIPCPNQSCLKDSKTGKQVAADFILMFGSVEEDGRKHCRWVSLPKNKLHREGAKKSPDAEVIFDPTRALVTDISEGY